jgi:hypothetical protein
MCNPSPVADSLRSVNVVISNYTYIFKCFILINRYLLVYIVYFCVFSSWKVLLPHPKAVAAAAAAQTSALCTGADDILEPYEFKEFLYIRAAAIHGLVTAPTQSDPGPAQIALSDLQLTPVQPDDLIGNTEPDPLPRHLLIPTPPATQQLRHLL